VTVRDGLADQPATEGGRGCYFTDPTGVIVGLHGNYPDV
jgi:hypothetical protein